MPKFIVHHDGFFFEWSTVVDAPVSAAMTRSEFESYYQGRYGTDGLRDLPNRLKRAIEQGCSAQAPGMSAEECVGGNRAGPDETEASFSEIIEQVIRERPECGLPQLSST